MLIYAFDVLFVITVVATAYLVSRQATAHAGVCLIALLLSCLFTIVGFEPFAKWLNRTYLTSTDELTSFYMNFVAALALFGCSITALFRCAFRFLPDAPEMTGRKEAAGRWVLGLMTGYFLAAFLLTIVQTFPGPRDFRGALPARIEDRPGPILRSAPDCQLLALVEYTCNDVFPLSGDWFLDRPIIASSTSGNRWVSFQHRHRQLRLEVAGYYQGDALAREQMLEFDSVEE